MADEDNFVRITLRLPAKVHALLTDAAGKKRSMNAEIISRLEDSFGENQSGSTEEIVERAITRFYETHMERELALDDVLKNFPTPQDQVKVDLLVDRLRRVWTDRVQTGKAVEKSVARGRKRRVVLDPVEGWKSADGRPKDDE